MSNTLEIIRSNARGVPASYNYLFDRAATAIDSQPNRPVREVIEEVMRNAGVGSYTSYATPVIAALEAQRNAQSVGIEFTATAESITTDGGDERSQIADKVREVLARKGIRGGEAEDVLIESGLVPAPFRKDDTAEYLRQFATRKGLSPRNTEDLLVEVGLVDPAPAEEPVAEPTDEGSENVDLAGVLASIQSTLSSLAAFARQHGFRG